MSVVLGELVLLHDDAKHMLSKIQQKEDEYFELIVCDPFVATDDASTTTTDTTIAISVSQSHKFHHLILRKKKGVPNGTDFHNPFQKSLQFVLESDDRSKLFKGNFR